MKQIIFNGRLSGDWYDEPWFVEISLDSYSFKKDGRKYVFPCIRIIEQDSDDAPDVYTEYSFDGLIKYVKAVDMCAMDVDKLIKGIKKCPSERIAMFGADINNICVRLNQTPMENEANIEERENFVYVDDVYD